MEIQMSLRDRAAAALDRTHMAVFALSNDPYTHKVRSYLAAWLDGKKMKHSLVMAGVRYLEMVAA